MRIVRELIDIRQEFPHPVLTIGNFDGVHVGHQTLFRQVIHRARAVNGTSAVLTFHPHPLKLFYPAQAPLLITTLEEKLDILKELGIRMVLCLDFTPEFARMDRREFVEEVLWGKIGVRELFVGRDFAFGRHRQGDIPYLLKRGAELGFEVHTVREVEVDGVLVSSSLIRRLIREGEVEQAARLLGRPYSLSGEVQEIGSSGEVSGRLTLQFRPQKELLPSPGFYAVKATSEEGPPTAATCLSICQVPSESESPIQLQLPSHLSQHGGKKVLRLAFLQRLCRAEECPPPLVEVKVSSQE